MTDQWLRPYAAKAIIQHVFDTNHLNLSIIFRFPMDQTVKPSNNLWICEVNESIKAVTASEWLDAFTMLLTVDDISSIPEKVTLEYNGPNQNLRITWGKQWEPWGPIVSSDSSLLPFGSFKGNEVMWQQAAAQDTWYTISDILITIGEVHKMTFEGNQEFKIAVAGFYQAFYYVTVECSIAGKHVLTAFQINGTEQPIGQTHKEFGRANEESSWCAPGLFNLAVDDVLSIGIMTPDIGNPTFTVDHVGMTIGEIGTT